MFERFESQEDLYFEWLTANPDGYVLNAHKKTNPNYLVLHSSQCKDISRKPIDGRYTERKYIKVCAVNQIDLFIWMKSIGASDYSLICSHCKPSASQVTIEGALDYYEVEVMPLLENPEGRAKQLESEQKDPEKNLVTTSIFIRNPAVIAEVLVQAKGLCAKCNSPAPFKRKNNGHPYLEVHHKIPLSQGGKDAVSNAEALCPNCHRAKHYGELG